MTSPDTAPPEHPSPRVRLAGSLRRFVHTESAGGAVLLVGAVVAVVVANTGWADGYESFWQRDLTLGAGRLTVTESLRHWVNDGLMTLFFLVVGLEVKRELTEGELRDPRAAALPALAALGGMVVPAALYAVVAGGGAGASGWGIPMATDIAFALGVTAVLGDRVPSSVKVFLLTLAVVDDIGAIVVIAVFYAEGFDPVALSIAVALVALFAVLVRTGVGLVVLVPVAVAAWVATFESGVHATIAGVALGLAVPTRPRHTSGPDTETEAGPADRLEQRLHPWTSFVVIPLFALANAGVALDTDVLDEPGAGTVVAGVVVGLIVGKTVGITVFAWLAVRLGLAVRPPAMGWDHLAAAAATAAIGFTVSLFVAGLAFERPELAAAAKLGILTASVTAGLLGAAGLWVSWRRRTRACRGIPTDR